MLGKVMIMQSRMQLLIKTHTAELDSVSAWCQDILCKQDSIEMCFR